MIFLNSYLTASNMNYIIVVIVFMLLLMVSLGVKEQYTLSRGSGTLAVQATAEVLCLELPEKFGAAI